MRTISADQFQQRYGTGGFGAPQEQPQNYGDQVKSEFKAGMDQFVSGVKAPQTAKNPLDLVEGGLQGALGLGRAAFSPITPAAAPVVSPVFKAADTIAHKIGDQVQNNPTLQKFAMSPVGEGVARGAKDIIDAGQLMAMESGAKGGKSAGGVAADTARSAPEAISSRVAPAAAYTKGIVKDIGGTAQGYINHQVSKALDLTPGDLSNLESSTGNSVGKWMADNNLIGANKTATQRMIDTFYEKNYNDVRAEIAKVKTVYKPSQVPRYTDALLQIQKKVEGVPGLEQTAADIDNLLAKKEGITLSDVQKVKELMDEHFNLYKVTGDVGESVAKQGLSNLRGELKSFIEKQVEKNTGADIKIMNNNVQTARGISDAITKRDPKGLTRSNINRGDIALAFFGFNFPLVGIPAFFLKKAYETPTVRLRIARAVDKWSDARKAAAQAEMQQGIVPQDLKDAAAGKEPQPEAAAKPESLLSFAKNNMGDERGFIKVPGAGGEEAVLKALYNYDATPATVKGMSATKGGNPQADFRLSQLQEKLSKQALSKAEIKEAETLLKKRGAL